MYAHTTNEGKETWQPLHAHLKGVAEMSAQFAAVFGAQDWGQFVGWLHDIGKVSEAFQRRLEGRPNRVDHSTAGGKLAFDLLGEKSKFAAALAAFPIMGHHGGLPNGGVVRTQAGTVLERSFREVPKYPRWREVLPQPFAIPQSLPQQMSELPENEQGFAAAFFIRMLFSCLTDADWLDTERFCAPQKFKSRPTPPAIELVLQQFNIFKQSLAAGKANNSHIAGLRAEIQAHCCTAALAKPGCFSLTVPTGGGKTLSSLAFALEHAKKHALSRIIYVIPFTSIIEQNAAVFRKALGPLGETAVLEHHCAYMDKQGGKETHTPAKGTPEQEGESVDDKSNAGQVFDTRLATQNWDATLVVTTAVQFFESLFAARPQACRKLHNIANSVIILDEAQMLPPELLNPCVMALRELVRGYGCSVVLCTATQPALTATKNLYAGFSDNAVREIIPHKRLPEIFTAFRRVNISYSGTLSNAALAQALLEQNQVLTIVNTRARARDVFESLGQGEGHYHLSALMYPEHRRRKLDKIRERLPQGLTCRVVSTSLIEAGVDVDFPAVFREETGLDSVAQAAGRCNREGNLPAPGKVTVFTPQSGLPRAPFFSRRAAAASWVRDRFDDLLSPQAVQAYFKQLYALESLDKPGILTLLDDALEDDELEAFPAIPFQQIAASFRLIEDDTQALIIECDDALPLLERLETTEDREEARALLRQLQSYTIQIYRSALPRLAVRTTRKYGLYVLSGATGYSDDIGLVLDDPLFREKEKNIF